MDNKELHNQLLEAFKTEARECVQSLFASFSEMEKDPDPETRRRLIEVIFREAHSLKGAARSVNIPQIEALCQNMEEIFARLKAGKADLSKQILDAFHEAVDTIDQYATAAPDGLSEIYARMTDLTERFSDHQAGVKNRRPAREQTDSAAPPAKKHPPQEGSPQKPPVRPLFSETVRIPTAKLDRLLLKAEALISLKQGLNQHLVRIRETGENIRSLEKHWKRLKPEVDALKRLSSGHPGLNTLLQVFESGRQNIQKTALEINGLIKGFEQSHRTLGGMADDILEEMKKASLLPFSTLFSILPHMVREIAGKQNKEVDVECFGEEVEIDRQILENIKDPLIHLLRNAVDHGIEHPEARRRKQKPARGLIQLMVFQPENNRVELTVQDDGAGIDTRAIRAQALKQSLLSPEGESAAKDADLFPLIFQSGISTSPILTEISGRGLGMAIVKDGIEALGGSISIDSAPDRFTRFTLQLPVTLATFRGILVSVSGHDFLIPNTHVAQVLKIDADRIKTAENRTMVSINGQQVSLVSLADTLGLPVKPAAAGRQEKTKTPSLPALVLKNSDHTIAFTVDEILNEQEVLVKNLGDQLKRVPHIAGATILGSGRVVLVLNVNDLFKTAALKALPAALMEPSKTEPEASKSILVVEDSLTARTLLKNILEASGYLVKTAVNGEDGFNQLKARPFHAVVSDIEMPRMNGFELTRKIRAEPSLTDTPVILVTNLDSPLDRERGIDAGADAYIVKGRFDRNTLLDIIARLI